MFWRNLKLIENRAIISTVLGKEVTLNQESISATIQCERIPNCFFPEWEKIYTGTGIASFKMTYFQKT